MKRNQPKAAIKAASVLAKLETPLYGLAAFVKPQPNIEYATLPSIIKAVTDSGRPFLNDAYSLAPSGSLALTYIKSVQTSLDSLDTAMQFMSDTGEADIGKPSRGYQRMVADVIRLYTGQAGRDWERAMEALGFNPGVGYLDGFLLEEGMVSASPEGRFALAMFEKCKPESRAALTQIIKTRYDIDKKK